MQASLIGAGVDLHLHVEKIQVEERAGHPADSSISTHRECQGTDTIHMSTRTLRRDYTDV